MTPTNAAYNLSVPFTVTDWTASFADSSPSSPPQGVHAEANGGFVPRISIPSHPSDSNPNAPGNTNHTSSDIGVIGGDPNAGGGGDSGNPSSGSSSNTGNIPTDPITTLLGIIAGQAAGGSGGGVVALPSTVTTATNSPSTGMIVVVGILAIGAGWFIYHHMKKGT